MTSPRTTTPPSSPSSQDGAGEIGACVIRASEIVTEFESIFGKLTATERRWLTRRIAGQEV